MAQPDGTGAHGRTDEDDAPPRDPDRDATPPGGRPVVGATVAVEVAGTDGSESVVARADTGATRTSVDTSLAAAVGAGPITGASRVRSAGGGGSRTRPVVDLVVGLDGDPHVVAASVEDRGQMRYPLLLGRDVLEHYHVDARRRAADDPAEGGAE